MVGFMRAVCEADEAVRFGCSEFGMGYGAQRRGCEHFAAPRIVVGIGLPSRKGGAKRGRLGGTGAR